MSKTHFEIYFHGLICFYADEQRHGNPQAPKTKVLFVPDASHLRTVIISDGAEPRRYFDDFTTINITVTDGDSGDIKCTSNHFQDDVPHLGDDDVTKPNLFIYAPAAIALALPLVEGKLQVAQRYNHEGTYKLKNNRQHPVARITVLKIKAESISIECDKKPPITIPPDNPWAAILNVSPRPKTAPVVAENVDACANHFQRYATILRTDDDKPARCEYVAEVLDDDATHPPDEKNGDHVEKVKALDELNYTGVLNQTQCSNSNWP